MRERTSHWEVVPSCAPLRQVDDIPGTRGRLDRDTQGAWPIELLEEPGLLTEVLGPCLTTHLGVV